jgi:protein-S-isoprenylcysteine O-methyltransferase Ste14
VTVPKDESTLRRLAANLPLAALYLMFAYAHVAAFVERPRLSVGMMAVVETLIIVAALSRHDPQDVQRDWTTLVTAAGGAFLPLFLRPVAGAQDLAAATLIQLAGFCLQIGALISLRRSFGVLPADRGLVTDGLYGLVRHPLYLAYMLSQGGYMLNNPSLGNLGILSAGCGFQLLHIPREEELLGRSAAYAAYAQAVGRRLLPGLW